MFNYKVKLSSKVDHDGKSQILIRLDVNRTFRPQLKTGIFVHRNIYETAIKSNIESKIDSQNGNLQNKEANDFRNQLYSFVNWLVDLTNQALSKKIVISTSWLQEMIDLRKNCIQAINRKGQQGLQSTDLNDTVAFNRVDPGQTPLYVHCMRYISFKSLKGTYMKSYINLAKTLVRYEMLRKFIDTPDFNLVPDQITSQDIEDIRKYFREEYALVERYPTLYSNIDEEYRLHPKTRTVNNRSGMRGDNSIKQMLRHMSMIWHWLIKEGCTTNNPFANICIGAMVYSTPIYINNEERDHIAQFDLSNYSSTLQETRDIFIFQSLVGCRISDLVRLTEDNIIGDFLEYIPYKTRHLTQRLSPRIPLVKQAKAIIERYAEFRAEDPDRRLLPFKPTSVYNHQIKELFKICGVTRSVSVIDRVTGEICMKHIDEIASSHMARRTFAGNIYNKVQDPNIVGKMTGHIEGSKAFARYRKIDDEVLLNAVKAIESES